VGEREGRPLVDNTARWFQICSVMNAAECEYREKTKQHE